MTSDGWKFEVCGLEVYGWLQVARYKLQGTGCKVQGQFANPQTHSPVTCSLKLLIPLPLSSAIVLKAVQVSPIAAYWRHRF